MCNAGDRHGLEVTCSQAKNSSKSISPLESSSISASTVRTVGGRERSAPANHIQWAVVEWKGAGEAAKRQRQPGRWQRQCAGAHQLLAN